MSRRVLNNMCMVMQIFLGYSKDVRHKGYLQIGQTSAKVLWKEVESRTRLFDGKAGQGVAEGFKVILQQLYEGLYCECNCLRIGVKNSR